MKKFWSTLVDQTCENFGWSEKVGQKTSFFHEVLKVEGVFTGNRFVSMIRCSKHFGRTCFHPNLLMSSYLVNWRKNFFLKFWHFSIFWPFLHIFSLLKIAVNNSSAIFTNVLHWKTLGYYHTTRNISFSSTCNICWFLVNICWLLVNIRWLEIVFMQHKGTLFLNIWGM